MIRKYLERILGENLTKSKTVNAKINFVIIIIMFVISAVMLFFLPEEIQLIHEGNKNYGIPSVLGVWLMPAIGLVNNLLLIKQKRLNNFNNFF